AESLETNEGDCLYSADTIEELAGFFGLDPKALVAEIDKYNAYCEAGEDGDWCKDPMFMMPLKNPPYYITKPETLFLMTIGAVFTDGNGQALDKNNNPIEGLYAIGVDGCMLYRNVYTIDVPASCCGNSVNMGRHAADHACANL
ncbi:MAG: FAD-binding protein, partial [Eggerthellales bacterium]|nr:FAD-binding protein [Eggerthellales bacterium]